MKNIQSLILYLVIAGGSSKIFSSHEETSDLKPTNTDNGNTVVFLYKRVDPESPYWLAKMMTTVPLYNGNRSEYENNLRVEFTSENSLSCTELSTEIFKYSDDSNKQKIEFMVHDLAIKKTFIEFMLHDLAIKKTFSDQLGTIDDLKKKHTTALEHKDFYKTIASFGLNRLLGSNSTTKPTISDELLKHQIAKYQKQGLKNLITNEHNFEQAKHLFVNTNRDNIHINNDLDKEKLMNTLEKYYNTNLQPKLKEKYAIDSNNREKYCYQAAIATVAAVGAGGLYLWSRTATK